MELLTGIRSRQAAIVALALFGCASSALAVDARVYQLENGGAIAPHLTLELGQDDNPLRGENGSEGAMYLLAEPELKYIVQRRNNTLTLGYNGQYLQYFEDYCSDPSSNSSTQGGFNTVPRPGDCASSVSPTVDKASYQNHSLSLEGFLEISRRARVNLSMLTSEIHQPLGTGLSANDSVLSALQEPDSRVRNVVRGVVSYGAYQARGEFRLGLTYSDRKYRNNGRNLSNLTEESLAPSATLLYRIGNRTQLVAGLGSDDVTGGNSERRIDRRFIGVEFDATAITSGSIRVSDVTEDFDLLGRDDLNYTGFDINLKWKPRRFSTVTIGGGRETERGLLTEGVGITTNLNLEWLHYWRERVSTAVELGIAKNESTSLIVNNDANDRTNIVRFEANYNLRRWLDVGAFVESDDRTGRSVNGESRDYSRTLIGLTANGTF